MTASPPVAGMLAKKSRAAAKRARKTIILPTASAATG
jgi:hypothetical protein